MSTDSNDQQTYTVTWTIDEHADNPYEAAVLACQDRNRRGSNAHVYTVAGGSGPAVVIGFCDDVPPSPAAVKARPPDIQQLADLAAQVGQWDAAYQEVAHKENHEGGAFSAWEGVEDDAKDIVRHLQHLLISHGFSHAKAPKQVFCEQDKLCEDCQEASTSS